MAIILVRSGRVLEKKFEICIAFPQSATDYFFFF